MTAPPDRCFDPVVDERTSVLLLGSLPGRASLAQQRYYAHPRNQFWRLAGAVIGRDIDALSYETRLDVLLHARFGLWDTVASAWRQGSLDANIRLERGSDLAGLIARLPRLRAIGFNGGTASRIGRRQLGGDHGLALVDLPSSSPAYTLPFDRKREAWLSLRPYLSAE